MNQYTDAERYSQIANSTQGERPEAACLQFSNASPSGARRPPAPGDPVEQVATTYLEALVADNPLVLNQLGTIAEPPAIRSFQSPRRDRGGDRDVRGSFAPIAALHARIDEDYTFDPKLGRFQPKNPLGPAAETLDALHAAKAKMEQEKVYEKMASADLDEVVDSVTAFGKVFSDMAEGTLAPAKLLPTYAQLVEQSKPPLSPDAQELALDYAANRESWDALLKRPFLTLKADGPFRLERAEVTAPVLDALGSSGDPPTTLRLTLTRFRLEGIDTGWKVTSARREGDARREDSTPESSDARRAPFGRRCPVIFALRSATGDFAQVPGPPSLTRGQVSARDERVSFCVEPRPRRQPKGSGHVPPNRSGLGFGERVGLLRPGAGPLPSRPDPDPDRPGAGRAGARLVRDGPARGDGAAAGDRHRRQPPVRPDELDESLHVRRGVGPAPLVGLVREADERGARDRDEFQDGLRHQLTYLYALDRRTGRTVWRVELPAQPSSPTGADEDRVMIGLASGKLMAFDVANGSPLWNWQTGGPILARPIPAIQLVAFASQDGKVYVALVGSRHDALPLRRRRPDLRLDGDLRDADAPDPLGGQESSTRSTSSPPRRSGPSPRARRSCRSRSWPTTTSTS